MALRKRQPSLRTRKAAERYEAMKKIDELSFKEINYGGEQFPLTKNEMLAKINECNKLMVEYNSLLEKADVKARELAIAEEELGELFTRVLAGGKSIFGINSNEVEMLGGTKKSSRKKSEKHRKEITINNLINSK